MGWESREIGEKQLSFDNRARPLYKMAHVIVFTHFLRTTILMLFCDD